RQAIARGKLKNTRCIVTESSFVKNRSVWVAKCEGQGTARYDTTYGGDNFESTVTTTSPGHESVITRQKGRRIGECKWARPSSPPQPASMPPAHFVLLSRMPTALR